MNYIEMLVAAMEAPESEPGDQIAPDAFPVAGMGDRFRCPVCFQVALVKLPVEIAATQSDGTTMLCDPRIGGCNLGFKHDDSD